MFKKIQRNTIAAWASVSQRDSHAHRDVVRVRGEPPTPATTPPARGDMPPDKDMRGVLPGHGDAMGVLSNVSEKDE